jgi:hypothetical protein
MLFRYSVLMLILIALLISPTFSHALEHETTSADTIAVVYYNDTLLVLKPFVQQVFRDVLFALTKTLKGIPDNITKMEILIVPNTVTIQVNEVNLQINSFVEELYREVSTGILKAMTNPPKAEDRIRIILFAS